MLIRKLILGHKICAFEGGVIQHFQKEVYRLVYKNDCPLVSPLDMLKTPLTVRHKVSLEQRLKAGKILPRENPYFKGRIYSILPQIMDKINPKNYRHFTENHLASTMQPLVEYLKNPDRTNS